MTDTALALIGISVVVSILLLVATLYYTPKILKGEEHDHEGNASRTGGHGA